MRESEEDVESAEACGQEPVAPSGRTEDGEATEEHEAESHDGDGLDRVRASGHDAGAVEQEPGCGKDGLHSGAEQEKCQKGPGDKGRSKAEDDFARGPGEQREAAAVRFPRTGK